MSKTQNQLIIEHLERFGSITALEALNAYGIMRLASRISDLRHSGYCIAKEMVKVTNRVNEVTLVARYYLLGKVGE